MELPKISVITVCRNVGVAIKETIDSIDSQSYNNIELIIVDGASTDNTVDIIKKNESRISKWISEPDNGIYDAMNKGLCMATGEWVSFINVGDSFADDNVIADIFSHEIPDHVKLIGGNTRNFFPDGHTEIHYAEPVANVRFNLIFSHQASFTRREIKTGKGSFQFNTKYRFAADYNLFYNIFHEYGESSIMLVDRVIANYKQEDSTSLVNFRKTKREYLKIQSCHPNKEWAKEVVRFLLMRR